MKTIQATMVHSFLELANAQKEEVANELIAFFKQAGTDAYVVINGNISLFDAQNMVGQIALPENRVAPADAYRFDGKRIDILNSSSGDSKKKNSSGGSSNNNNNNNNNNNG